MEYDKPFLFQPHEHQSISLLSTEAPSSNYRGFVNLAMIILVAANFRLIIENILKYGLLITIPDPRSIFMDYGAWPCFFTYVLLIVPLLLSYYIEIKIGPKRSQALVSFLQTLVFFAILIIPPAVIYHYDAHFVPAILLLDFTSIAAMKQYSFSDVMKDARESFRDKSYKHYPSEIKEVISKYPNIVNLHQFVEFIFFPTLCFQFHYPRTERIRKIWLAKRIIEYILSLSMMHIMFHQYIMPILANTLPHINDENISLLFLAERHLKLAIPSLYLWLVMFLSLFQYFLNIMAELTRFADRTFYKEWWNSKTLGEYWRLWNIPVHAFLVRHIYMPLIKQGYSKRIGLFVVFTLSALAHEYLISSACKIVTYWAFLSMIMQIPVILISDLFKKHLQKSQLGNVVFWVGLCIVGQPMILFIYAHHSMHPQLLNQA